MHTREGLPQRSAFSETLFLIAINNIAQYVQPSIKYNMFADDFNYWRKSNNIYSIAYKIYYN